jgi:type II secretory pathway component GspD/PulD (secretin)
MMLNTDKCKTKFLLSISIVIMLLLCFNQTNLCAQKISFKLDNVDVVEILKTISEQSDYNIAIGAGVTGKVTLYLDSVDVIDAVEIITELAGMAFSVENKTIRVLSRNQYTEMYGSLPFDKRILKTYKLDHTQPAKLINELNKMKSPKGVIIADGHSNKLYLLETPGVLKIMESIIAKADIEHGFRVYNLQFVTPDVLVQIIKGFLTSTTIITPDMINNRLIVIDHPDNLDQLDSFIADYDSPNLLKTITFKLQYSNAPEILAQIQSLLTPNIGRIITDAASNQLIVTDLPDKVDILAEMISDFDIKIPEVFIEAKIVQVSLTDNLKLGVNWRAMTDEIDNLGKTTVSADFNILSASDQGMRFTSGLLAEDDYEVVLEALAEKSQTDLVSSPHITAVNNKEARILVGSSVPYKTIDTREENGSIRTFEKVTMVEVGVKLYVTPHINDNDFVKMHIRPEVSSVTSFSDGIPVVEKTEAETEVLVKDGVTLIIGGLIKNEQRKTKKSIPILGSIPLLGALFSSTDNQLVKSELIIFITPHIITGEVTQIQPEG